MRSLAALVLVSALASACAHSQPPPVVPSLPGEPAPAAPAEPAAPAAAAPAAPMPTMRTQLDHDALPAGATLLVAVRTRAYVDYVLSQTHAELLAPPQPIAGDLVAVTMVDLPDRARLADARDPARFGLSRDEAVARARTNLVAKLGSVASLIKPTKAGELHYFATGSYYESSLLLDLDGWAKVATSQPGTLVVCAATTDMLFYKWITDPSDLVAFRGITGEIARRSQTPLSPTILRWNGKGWEVQP